MKRGKLYLFVLSACSLGFIWLLYNSGTLMDGREPAVCLFKQFTGVPCPSCGSTRSVLSLLRGDISGALALNPLGLIILIILVAGPPWILSDLIFKKSTFQNFYQSSESFLKKRPVALSLVLLVLINWIWNIVKGL